MAKKLNLSTQGDKVYGDFARNYRQSSNVEDRRDGRGLIRATTDMFGRPDAFGRTNTRDVLESKGGNKEPTSTARASNRSPGTTAETTPDDNSDDFRMYGGGRNTTTPSSTRKVDAEEAVRKTHLERN